MNEPHHVFLIPGFFGFTNLGEALYFAHVERILPEVATAVGLEITVHTIGTYPTSSIRKRAVRLLAEISNVASGDEAPIHLVGHSSGGLDARLLVSPGITLSTEIDVERFASRIESVVLVSTPSYGTPVASFFTSLFGQKLLQLLSLGTIYSLWFGRLPSSVVFKLGAALAKIDRLIQFRYSMLDQLYSQLLNDFSPERREAIEQFMVEVGTDQSLLPQLTPEGTDVLNAGTSPRAGVRYGSVISYARPPGLISAARVGLDPYGQATHALFYGLYSLAKLMPKDLCPELTYRQIDALLQTYGTIPDATTNDGVVPTISQIFGTIIHATEADHLDVLGHFGDATCTPPHYDWLASGCSFGRAEFEALWRDVAGFLAGKAPQTSEAERPPNRSRAQHASRLFSRPFWWR